MEARKVLTYVRKWFWFIVLACLIGGIAGLMVSLLQPKIYEADTTLYVNSPGRTDYQSVTGDEESAKALTQIPQSNAVLTATIQAVGDKSLSLSKLFSMVTVANTPGTKYVTIGVRDSNPGRAARLATEIARQSITQFETATDGGDQTKQFVQQQMNTLANEISNLENQLAQAQSSTGPGTSTPAVPVDQLNTKLNQDRTLYNQLLSSYTSMSSTKVTVVQPAVIPQNPVGLGKTLAIAIGMLIGLIVIVGVIILIEQIDDIVRTPEKVDQVTKLSTLTTVAYLPVIAKQFPQINARYEVSEKSHRQLIEDTDTDTVKVDSRMVKQAHLLMRRSSELTEDTSQEAIGFVEVPKTPWTEDHHQVTDDTPKRLPVVARPKLAGAANFEVRSEALNEYQLPEEFLTLGVLLGDENGQLTSSGSKIRSLLITSPENGDGKTSIASLTALGLARIGTSVVLVDANIRKPEVHNFNLSDRVDSSHKVGLSSMLSDSVKVEPLPLCDALKETDEPNLVILPSGPVIDSSSRLLSSAKMTALLKLLTEKAFVIVDSPAVLTTSDAVILAKKCDAVLMVVDARHTTSARLNQALEILTRVNMNILGVVLNRASN